MEYVASPFIRNGKRIAVWLLLLLSALFCLPLHGAVELEKAEGGVDVRIDGDIFTRYNFADSEFPFFYPLKAPGGVNVTRHWPMSDAGEHEQQDHKHHKSLWFTHGDVNGLDFWTHGKAPDIVQTAIVAMRSGENEGTLITENEWRNGKGEVVCKDTRHYRFGAKESYRYIDIEIQIEPNGKDLKFGDTKEGSMAVRVTPELRLKGKVAKGHILMKNGIRDGKAWGKRSPWCYYYGPIGKQAYGVAIFDSPRNLRHPTWWHARDYGLCAANPFGISYFDSKPRGTGDHVVETGDVFTLRYRIIISRGQLAERELNQLYSQYSQ